jgi:replicative DNA helicase
MKITEEAMLAETIVLASLLNYGNQFLRYGIELHPKIWSVPAHQVLFQAMRQQYAEHGQIDLVGLRHTLTEKGVDLSVINNLPPGISHQSLDIYIKIIRDFYQKSSFVKLGYELIEAGNKDDVWAAQLDIMVQDAMRSQSEVLSYNKTKRIGDVISDAMAQKLRSGTIPWFSQRLQSCLGHIKNGEITIVGGRPGMGTQAFCINQVLHTALDGNTSVLYISLKTPAWQLVLEMAALTLGKKVSEVSQEDMTDTNTESGKVIEALNNAPLHLIDDPTLNINELIQLMRYHYVYNQVKFIVIEDIQHLFLPKQYKSRDRELTIICHELKALAKEFNIPIFCSSQISRLPEKRGGFNFPMLSDLRDSGSIEEIAATVLMLYRPECYGRTEFEDGTSTFRQMEVHVAKNTDGSLQTVRLMYNPPYLFIGDEIISHSYYIPTSRQNEFDDLF